MTTYSTVPGQVERGLEFIRAAQNLKTLKQGVAIAFGINESQLDERIAGAELAEG
jgi:hypothetical protein